MEKKEKILSGDALSNNEYLLVYENYQVLCTHQSDLRISIYPVAVFPDMEYDFFAYIDNALTGFIPQNMTSFDEFYALLEWYSRHIRQPFFKLFKDRPA